MTHRILQTNLQYFDSNITETSDERKNALFKYTTIRPILNWDQDNRKGIYSSGWNSFKKNKTNISFRCSSFADCNMSFTLEFPTPSNARFSTLNKSSTDKLVAFGFFFYINILTNKVDLYFRVKQFYGNEHTILYRDCKYIGLQEEYVLYDNAVRSRIVVSNDWQDKTVVSDLNFANEFQDFHHIIEYINDSIQFAITKMNINNNLTAHAMPLLRIVGEHQSSRSINTAIAEPPTNNDIIYTTATYVDDDVDVDVL